MASILKRDGPPVRWLVGWAKALPAPADSL
jgi:hypothetical protein